MGANIPRNYFEIVLLPEYGYTAPIVNSMCMD
jgi:hypothetical protein